MGGSHGLPPKTGKGRQEEHEVRSTIAMSKGAWGSRGRQWSSCLAVSPSRLPDWRHRRGRPGTSGDPDFP
eukprot:6108833-Pyramimonas_sp.AAC.2